MILRDPKGYLLESVLSAGCGLLPHALSSSANSKPLGLYGLTRGYRGPYLASVGAMAVGIGLLFVVPVVIRSMIDGFVSKEGEGGGGYSFVAPEWVRSVADVLGVGTGVVTSLMVAGALIIVVTVMAGLFQYLKGHLAARASEAIVRSLRNTLHSHLAALPATYFDTAETGDLVQRCTSDVETVRVFLAAQVVEIGRSILLVVCVTPVLFALSASLAWVTLALLPLLVIYSVFFFGRLTRYFTDVDEAEARLTTVLQENLTGIRVVRSFGRREFEEQKFTAANHEHRDKTNLLMRLLARFWGFSDLVCMSQGGLVLFFGAWWTLRGEITLGTMVAFTMYSAYVIWPVRQMGRTLVDAGKARVSLRRLGEVLAVQHEDATDKVIEDPLSKLSGSIHVKDLSFSYGRGNKLERGGPRERDDQQEARQVLQSVSFELQAGQTLALLGPPGSGKSTLIRLLLRLYDYDGDGGSGSIELDGYELSGLSRDFIRNQVAVVMQDPFLYARTIDENLLFGRPTASSEDIQAATSAAAIHDSIEGFSEGYGTMLGERGVTLSGGQKQRLAIARVLLKQAPILILDDALSAVDHETEGLIMKALGQRRGQHTTIIIAHRLSCVTQADLILVFDQGRVVERGKHEDLLAQGGAYSRLWAIQSAFKRQIDAHGDRPDLAGESKINEVRP